MNLLLWCIFCYRETEEQVGDNEKNTNTSPEIKQGEEDGVVVNKENAVNEPEEKEPEEKVNVLVSIEISLFVLPFVLFSIEISLFVLPFVLF